MRSWLWLSVLLTSLALWGCQPPPDESAEASQDELRQLIPGVDIDEVLVENVRAANAPAHLSNVRSWDVRYVELRDPKDRNRPDPVEPFTGFFLVAKDDEGVPLFFDTMSLTAKGVAHFYFSFKTTAGAQYVELPLLAPPGDEVAAKRVQATAEWLTAEKVRLGKAIERASRRETMREQSTALLRPAGWTETRLRLKCVVDLAVFALTISSPIGFFFAQAGVEAGFALADGILGAGGSEGAVSAGALAAVGGAAKGVKKAVDRYVSVERAQVLKRVGGGAMLVGFVGVVGYQAFANISELGLEEGAIQTLKDAVKLVSDACYDWWFGKREEHTAEEE